jgi:hypothetical protein
MCFKYGGISSVAARVNEVNKTKSVVDMHFRAQAPSAVDVNSNSPFITYMMHTG